MQNELYIFTDDPMYSNYKSLLIHSMREQHFSVSQC